MIGAREEIRIPVRLMIEREPTGQKDLVTMQKKRVCLITLLVLTLIAHMAAAQTLPGIDCFSPGLVRLAELEAQRAPVSAEAEIKIDNAVYARDLSVLASMLSGSTIRYDGVDGAERLSILRDGQTLSSFALWQGEDGAVVGIGDQAYAAESAQAALEAVSGVSLPGYGKAEAVLESLRGTAILERVPLDRICTWIEGLEAGEALAGGFVVTQPFAAERTMSDDGTRLTRIDITGQIAREGEAPYTVSGFLRQPAGRAPKDTFELKVAQDEKNFFELSYSALRENEIASKNKKGTTSVRTALKIAGKVAGSRISSRLTVTMKNNWTADGETLSEKIAVTATLEHQDGRPGMRMFRLNTVGGKLKNNISLTTNETANDMITLDDEIAFELVMDENTCMNVSANASVQMGGDAPSILRSADVKAASADEIAAAVEGEIQSLAAALYPHLSENAKEKAVSGL